MDLIISEIQTSDIPSRDLYLCCIVIITICSKITLDACKVELNGQFQGELVIKGGGGGRFWGVRDLWDPQHKHKP